MQTKEEYIANLLKKLEQKPGLKKELMKKEFPETDNVLVFGDGYVKLDTIRGLCSNEQEWGWLHEAVYKIKTRNRLEADPDLYAELKPRLSDNADNRNSSVFFKPVCKSDTRIGHLFSTQEEREWLLELMEEIQVELAQNAIEPGI